MRKAFWSESWSYEQWLKMNPQPLCKQLLVTVKHKIENWIKKNQNKNCCHCCKLHHRAVLQLSMGGWVGVCVCLSAEDTGHIVTVVELASWYQCRKRERAIWGRLIIQYKLNTKGFRRVGWWPGGIRIYKIHLWSQSSGCICIHTTCMCNQNTSHCYNMVKFKTMTLFSFCCCCCCCYCCCSKQTNKQTKKKKTKLLFNSMNGKKQSPLG